MPIYEYKCKSCGEIVEKLQKFSDPPLTQCPHCQKPQLEKLISQAAFHLKGGGWFNEGYHKSVEEKAPSASTESAKASEPKKEVKTEQKAEQKPKASAPTDSKPPAK